MARKKSNTHFRFQIQICQHLSFHFQSNQSLLSKIHVKMNEHWSSLVISTVLINKTKQKNTTYHTFIVTSYRKHSYYWTTWRFNYRKQLLLNSFNQSDSFRKPIYFWITFKWKLNWHWSISVVPTAQWYVLKV